MKPAPRITGYGADRATVDEEGAPAVIRLDGGGRIIDASAAVEMSLGLDRQRLTGRALWDVAVPVQRRDRHTVRRRGSASVDVFVGAVLEIDLVRADATVARGRLQIDLASPGLEHAYVATLVAAGAADDAQSSAARGRAPTGVVSQPLRGIFAGSGNPPAGPGSPGARTSSASAPASPARSLPASASASAAHLEDLLHDALARATRDSTVAVLRMRTLDLPLVTEVLGRAAGDELLCITEAEIRAALPEAVAVGRLFGGDVCALLTRLDHDATDRAREAARRVLARLAGTADVAGETLRLSCTIGIALATEPATDVAEVLNHAERAAREPTADGEPIRFATTTGSDRRELLRLRASLEGVAERDELRLVYQPIFDLSRQMPYGVEALLRWQHPRRGLIPPDEFIPVAEETGAIDALGSWVIEELCRQARQWIDRDIHLQLHFNVSALELQQPGYARRLLSTIRRHFLPASTFTLEVTESTVVLDAETALPVLYELRGAGMHIAIDDFGAGHSSLSRLKDLPADVLKIDRALVAGLPNSSASQALVTAALDIADAMKMFTVAEGIETDAQRRFLADAGCPLGQGFALGAVQPAEARGLGLLTAARLLNSGGRRGRASAAR